MRQQMAVSRRCQRCNGPNNRPRLSARICDPCLGAAAERFRANAKRGLGAYSPLRRQVWERDGGRCRLCNRVVRRRKRDRYDYGKDLGEVDHIIPKIRGGLNTPENLRLLCLGCNRAKGSR
jgi:5-methylcytosine-specific restriction endonuclease McrA